MIRHERRPWGWALVAALWLMTLFCPAAVAKADAYRLGYGDAVTVTVIGHPTLSIADQPVRPDGKLALPLVQEVAVQGRTVPEVVAGLIKAFKPYLTDPQIVVSVSRFRPLRVTVLGQVQRPGTFDFTAAPTLLDAIASAGGLTDRAARGQIKVVGPAGTVTLYDLDRLLMGQEALPRLAEGSTIEVAEVWGVDWYRLAPIAGSLISAAVILARDFYWY